MNLALRDGDAIPGIESDSSFGKANDLVSTSDPENPDGSAHLRSS
jgi:hypothetical protein